MAILDQGENTLPSYNTRADGLFTRQFCFSFYTLSNFQEVSPPTKLNTASYCSNDSYRDLNSYFGARLPRIATALRYRGQPTNEQPISQEVGRNLTHGNSVSSAIFDFSSDINHTHIQVFYGKIESNGSLKATSASGIIRPALAYLQNIMAVENIKAVNASFQIPVDTSLVDNICDDKKGQAEVNALYRSGVVVFTGLLNENTSAGALSWPACLDKVIKVGRVGTTTGIGVGGNGIDFFAKGTARVPSGSIGNSFAAPRVAAFYALLSEKFPFATVEEKLNAMKVARRNHTYRGITKPYIKKEDIAPAIALLAKDYKEEPTIAERVAAGELIIRDVLKHGPLFRNDKPEYRVEFDMTKLQPQQQQQNKGIQTSASKILDGRRDAVLSFRASSNSSTTIYLRVTVNGVSHGDYPASRAGTKHTVEVHRKFLRAGNNVVTIKPINPSSAILWGVDGFRMNFHPAINLSLGIVDTNEYGYQKTPARYTGVRFRVKIEDRKLDHKISMEGWDIDVADETEVYMNGTFLGHLKVSRNNAYGEKSSFIARKSLLRNGINHIELVQRETGNGWSGLKYEKWAVKNILVEPSNSPTLSPLMLLLLDDD